MCEAFTYLSENSEASLTLESSYGITSGEKFLSILFLPANVNFRWLSLFW